VPTTLSVPGTKAGVVKAEVVVLIEVADKLTSGEVLGMEELEVNPIECETLKRTQSPFSV
jgi:hypothetical protein